MDIPIAQIPFLENHYDEAVGKDKTYKEFRFTKCIIIIETSDVMYMDDNSALIIGKSHQIICISDDATYKADVEYAGEILLSVTIAVYDKINWTPKSYLLYDRLESEKRRLDGMLSIMPIMQVNNLQATFENIHRSSMKSARSFL
jgi:hypothetical protein